MPSEYTRVAEPLTAGAAEVDHDPIIRLLGRHHSATDMSSALPSVGLDTPVSGEVDESEGELDRLFLPFAKEREERPTIVERWIPLKPMLDSAVLRDDVALVRITTLRFFDADREQDLTRGGGTGTAETDEGPGV